MQQAQRSVETASEQLQTATRQAAHQVREAEQRNVALGRELDALRHKFDEERTAWMAAQESADKQRETEGKAHALAASDRDIMQRELAKSKAELEALRHHLLDVEESGTRREAEQAPSPKC